MVSWQMYSYKDELVDGWMDGGKDIYLDGWMNEWTQIWMDGLASIVVDSWMNELEWRWMDEWMKDGYMDELKLYIYIRISKYMPAASNNLKGIEGKINIEMQLL